MPEISIKSCSSYNELGDNFFGSTFLGRFQLKPGSSILIKPNWVLHENLGGYGTESLVTHPLFILAVLKEVFKSRPSKVVIGDAPLQSCDFNAVVSHSLRDQIHDMATCPVEIIDFRRTVMNDEGLAAGQHTDIRERGRYILFDFGVESLLEEVSSPSNRFRITCYDPDILAKHHGVGRHRYLLCKEPFEADVIINLPKLKTHKKSGITAALKNIVGINGNKEYLPHHRFGGSRNGGDCYNGFVPLKLFAEYCLDKANRYIGTSDYRRWKSLSERLLEVQKHFGNAEVEGAWFGNDTVWRMTLDLNRLLLYGRMDGSISDMIQRKVYTITDAIVAGEGEGPLAPEPNHLGLVTVADNSACADFLHTALMGFDFRRIPLVREAFKAFRYPIASCNPSECRVRYNSLTYTVEAISRLLGKPFKPSFGWLGHIESDTKDQS